MEIAFISSNKIYLELEKKQDNFISKTLSKLTENPSKFIAAMFIGNTIALVIYGFLMSNLLLAWLGNLGFYFSGFLTIFLQILFSTILILATAEFLSNVFFPIYANSLIKFFAIPAYGFYLLFYYISSFFIRISDFILIRFFKTQGDQVSLYFSKAELGNYITEQMSTVENDDEMDSEIQMFQNALDFSGVKARDIMTPEPKL